jgi:hypothetical protein
MEYIFIIVLAIGAICIGLPLLAVMTWLWWIAIPIVCAIVGGGLGFVFGVGLDVVLFIGYQVMKSLLSAQPTFPTSNSITSNLTAGPQIVLAPPLSPEIRTKRDARYAKAQKQFEKVFCIFVGVAALAFAILAFANPSVLKGLFK